jgi:hypothetical protein
VVGDRRGADVCARGHTVSTSHVVLCTNGFTDHVVEDEGGAWIRLHQRQQVVGTIGFMAAFFEERPRTPAAMSYIRNPTIGGDTPYAYVTRRSYDRPDGTVTLTCMGGLEHPIEQPWVREDPFPGAGARLHGRAHPTVCPADAPGGADI